MPPPPGALGARPAVPGMRPAVPGMGPPPLGGALQPGMQPPPMGGGVGMGYEPSMVRCCGACRGRWGRLLCCCFWMGQAHSARLAPAAMAWSMAAAMLLPVAHAHRPPTVALVPRPPSLCSKPRWTDSRPCRWAPPAPACPASPRTPARRRPPSLGPPAQARRRRRAPRRPTPTPTASPSICGSLPRRCPTHRRSKRGGTCPLAQVRAHNSGWRSGGWGGIRAADPATNAEGSATTARFVAASDLHVTSSAPTPPYCSGAPHERGAGGGAGGQPGRDCHHPLQALPHLHEPLHGLDRRRQVCLGGGGRGGSGGDGEEFSGGDFPGGQQLRGGEAHMQPWRCLGSAWQPQPACSREQPLPPSQRGPTFPRGAACLPVPARTRSRP